ncbi:hypothetical protein GIB67_024131 [Kingdonia uniflora]|uniref:Uncharacterized protein n=1 Tax=Kingdonia uniflora TaxID=39325 RepID=A0A7J7MMS2_9MAGN|nr:hypothetical protein GIB67_024131 [Kingdonia uniflora]
MENVNIAENVESDSLNEVFGFGGDDGGGSSVASKPPSQGDLSFMEDSTLEDLAEDMVLLNIDRQEESIASGSGALQSM